MPNKFTIVENIVRTLESPEGFEFTGENRIPRKGEWFYWAAGGWAYPQLQCKTDDCEKPYPILRKEWVAPEWLPEGCWVWHDHNLDQWMFGDFGWKHTDNAICAGNLAALHGETFTPPCGVDGTVRVTHG